MKHLLEYLDFSDLSTEAADNAIEKIRQERYEDYDICSWAVDDSELFEPPHEEMTRIFGDDYYEENGNQFMLDNWKPESISFVGQQDQNHFLQMAWYTITFS